MRLIRKTHFTVLVVLLLALLMCVITGCGETEESSSSEKIALEAITLVVDKTEAEIGDVINISFKPSPQNPETHLNSTYNPKHIEYFVRIDGVDTRLTTQVESTTYTMTTSNDIIIWAKYCNHRSFHAIPSDTTDDIVSNLVTIKAKVNNVSTVEELKAIAGSNKAYKLACDIDMGGATWSPISFAGTLNGDGHTISNFVLSDTVDNLGFFGTLTGKIINTTFSGVTLNANSGKTSFGVIAGINQGTIEKCTVYAEILTPASKYVGGIVGTNAKEGTVKGCLNYASITANDYVGGIAGSNAGALVSCTNEGTINGASYVGGIAGTFSGTCDKVENRAEISATGNYVGGIFGEDKGQSKDRKNLANVTSSGDYVGGIVGYSEGGSSGNENSGHVTGRYYVGGFFGQVKGDISGITNTVNVTGRAYIGGIVGKADGVIQNCTNNGMLTSLGTIIEENVSRSYLGGIAGYCKGLENCKNTTNLVASGTKVGGLAGSCAGNVTNCQNDGDINGGDLTGGIVGEITTGTISNAINNGIVTGKSKTGGIVGYTAGNKVEYSTNNAPVTGEESVGGLIGYAYSDFELNASENKANVVGRKWVGGYLGYSRKTTTIRNAINNNSVIAECIAGGILGVGSSTTLDYCENYGTITVTGTYIEDNVARAYAGGLAGSCYAINNGKNVVNISANGDRVGGLAGYVGYTIMNSKNDGDVSGKGQTGGLAGYANGNIISSNNYGDVTGENHTGGLAGYTCASKIDNCINEGVVNGDDYTGGLAGYAYSQIEVTASSNRANVTGEIYVGGYIGSARTTTTIRNATNNNTISARAYVGGIIGWGSSATLHYCENYGAITASSTVTESSVAYSYIGGLAGYCSYIYNGKNTVNISGIGARVGGLCGYGYSMNNSSNYGNITGKDYTGGIAGQLTGNVVDCENNGAVTGDAYTGGIVGHINASKIDGAVNTGAVIGKNYTGGIVGYSYNTIEITGVQNKADIKGDVYVGGYVGYSRTTANIRQAINKNKVEAKAYVGGIVGYGSGATLYYCENSGVIVASSTVTESSVAYSYIGGLAGYCTAINNGKNTVNISGIGACVGGLCGRSTGVISNSCNTGNVTGKDYTGGISGRTDGNILDSSNTGHVEGVKYVGGSCGYINASKIDNFKNSGNVSGTSCVGGLVGYSYTTFEISASKNSANVVGTDATVGSFIGQTRTTTTIRTSENTGNKDATYIRFIGTYSGTTKGVMEIGELNTYDVKETDELALVLDVSAIDYITKESLSGGTMMVVEGEQVAGNTIVLKVWFADSYENIDSRCFRIRVYSAPTITQTATTVSVKTDPTYISSVVSFDTTESGVSVPSQTVTSSSTLKYPTVPTREGYAFAGWYTTPSCEGEPYDFTKEVTQSFTLYAKWVSVDYTALVPNVTHTESFSSSQEKCFAFVPLTSGTITIKTARGSGDVDGYLLNSAKASLVSDTANSADVNISYSVTAGTLYYIKIKSHSGSGNTPIIVSSELPADGGFAVSCEKAKEILGIVAQDDFGEDVDVEVVLKSGTFSVGNRVVYTIKAIDKVGNTYSIDTNPILVTQ